MSAEPDDAVEVTSRRHVSESAHLDPESLDPKYHYRMIQTRQTSVARAKLKGYRLVKPSVSGERTTYGEEDAPGDDIIQHGDRVLMRMPIAKHKELDVRRKARTESRLLAPERKAREEAKERGIRTYDKDDDDDEK